MTSSKVLWPKVFGIAAIQAAITLTWVIYNLYLTKLLVNHFGFSKELATSILIVENALEAIIEPIAGAWSDRQQQRLGNKLPLVSVAVVASSVLFISIPILVAVVNPQSGWRWLLPIVAVLWASAMAVFRSPVLSLLGKAAPISQLPQAASIITLFGQLVGAFRFDVYGIIVGIGPGFAFTIGSIALLAAVGSLRWVYAPHLLPTTERQQQSIPWPTVGLVAGLGFSTAIGLRFLFPAVQATLKAQWGSDIKLVMTLFFVSLGMAALLAGKISGKIGILPAMLRGLLFTALSLQILVFGHNILLIVLSIPVLIISLSLVLNSAVPLVLNLIPASHSGMGVGVYFGSMLAAFSLFDGGVMAFGDAPPLVGALGCGIAFLCAVFWISRGKKLYRS